MKKIIVVSLFMVALFMPQIISTGAYALTNHSDKDRRDGQYDDKRGDRSDDDRQVRVADVDEDEETSTTIVEQDATTTTTTIPSEDSEEEDETTTTTTPAIPSECVNAQWKDNGKTFMEIPEKEFSFQVTCASNANTNTTVLAYFFYGYDYKTIEKFKETTTTIILAPTFSPATSTPTTTPLVPFPNYANNNVTPVANQEVAMVQEPESTNDSNSFSMPIVLTSLGSILIYGIKKSLLLPL